MRGFETTSTPNTALNAANTRESKMINERIDDVTGNVEVKQDRLTISDDSTEGTVHINQKWDTRPLTVNETHATIKLSTEHGTAQIALDGVQLDAILDALYHVQEEYRDE